MKAILYNAAKLSHKALTDAYPGHIVIGTRTIRCPVFVERGMRWEGDGGQVQKQTIKVQPACHLLPDSEIVDATTGESRPVRFTHQETGLVYQLSTEDAPRKHPSGYYWSVTGTQVTKV